MSPFLLLLNEMAADKPLTSLSKFLSYVLRHHPEAIDLTVDQNGWVSVDELIQQAQHNGTNIDRSLLQKIIRSGKKRRFILSEDNNYIRASYGHSINIDLNLRPKNPPNFLYHGTAERKLSSILSDGLRPQGRNLVHLSTHKTDAKHVGSRHGHPVVLTIDTQPMPANQYPFYRSESEAGIWLTPFVPAQFIAT